MYKGDQFISVTLSRNEKSRGKDVVCYKHNHSLEYLDTIKANQKVKTTVAAEVAKGYRPSDINRNIKGVKWAANKKALENVGGVHLDLKKIHNAGATWKRQNPAMRIAGARIKWEDQLEECLVMLQVLPAEAAVTYEIITVQRKTDGCISHGIIFGKLSRLQTLMRRGHLTLMDATHNTNRLHWKLFTVMIRHEYGNWIPGAHMLSEYEDGDIIATFLLHLRRWCGGDGGWQPRYFLTDDLAAEQRAVGLAFEDSTGDNSVENFLYRTHSERKLTRNLAGLQYKKAKSHLYAALYLRHTEAGCEESILAAIAAVPEN